MKIYNIKEEYIEFIKQYDAKVPFLKVSIAHMWELFWK